MAEWDIEIEKKPYLSKKQWKNKYPSGRGGYRVVGAIGKNLGAKKGVLRIGDEECEYYKLPKNNIKYVIKGYLEIEEDTYLAVVKYRIKEWFFLLLLIGCLIGLVYFFIESSKGPSIDPGSNKYKPDIEISEQIDPGKISLPGFGEIKMKANTDTAYVALWNPDRNPCYFKYTIIVEQTNKVIYTSKLIPPGEAVTTVKFREMIPKGVTKATIQIETYKLDDYQEKMNGGEISVKLVGLE